MVYTLSSSGKAVAHIEVEMSQAKPNFIRLEFDSLPVIDFV